MDEYTPDADASGLDRRVMEIARMLHDAGWVEEAKEVGAAMAEIREAAKNPHDWSGVYDQMSMVSGAAARIAKIVNRCYPDGIELG